MTGAIKKALPQILATVAGAMIGAAGLYLATSAETTVAADQVHVEQARLVIEQERADIERMEALHDLYLKLDQAMREMQALRAENADLRLQVKLLSAELKQLRVARQIDASRAASERAEADRMEPRAPAPIDDEPKPKTF